MRNAEYLTAAQTADVIRKTLKRTYHGLQTWVRTDSYAGGASINIYFDGTDGYVTPTTCHCSAGPTGLRTPGDPCRVCGYIPRWERKRKPGAPTRAEVEKLTKGFGGKGFDGMIDMEYYIDAYLDEAGNVVGTVSPGTEGSRGSVPAWDGPVKTDRLVSFGAGYIHVEDEPPYDVRAKKRP